MVIRIIRNFPGRGAISEGKSTTPRSLTFADTVIRTFRPGARRRASSSRSSRRHRRTCSLPASSPLATASNYSISWSRSTRKVLPAWKPPKRCINRMAVRRSTRSSFSSAARSTTGAGKRRGRWKLLQPFDFPGHNNTLPRSTTFCHGCASSYFRRGKSLMIMPVIASEATLIPGR